MKKAAIIIVSLVCGVIIGFFYRDCHSDQQEEVKKVFTEGRKQCECISTLQNVYYTGDNYWEDMDFQGWDNFGPV